MLHCTGPVLIVEDDLNTANLVKTYLEHEGFTCEIAADGEKAVLLARHRRPCIIILDIMLPKLDGWEVCRQVRTFSDVPVLMLTAREEEIDRVIKPFADFLSTKSKSEVSEEAVKRGVMSCPVSDIRDICDDLQLKARDFWVDVEHPELGSKLTYNGPFVKLSEAPLRIRRRAPLVGEHNQEIYIDELGITGEELVRMRQGGSI